MDDTERRVQTWMATKNDELIRETAEDVISGRTKWLAIVRALGEFLTSEDDDVRSNGVAFISSVLQECPSNKINRQSTHVLITFLCSKLEDPSTMISALKGLLVLTKSPSCSSDDALSIQQQMFQHVQMKALVKDERFIVWSIMDAIISNDIHRQALKLLGPTFVRQYTSYAEGEKDPRNLLIAFALARVVLIEFDCNDSIESLFNITYCYFPIAYRPPPNDPYNIATDDLRNALRACLSACPAFGPLAFPVFLEKLMAGSPPTKRDTLETLSQCIPVFGPSVCRSWARKLWNSLKLEIFQPVDLQTEKCSLATVKILIQTIYSAQESSVEKDEDIQGLARDACGECLGILKEPEKSQAGKAVKVLCAFLGTTPSIAKFTISQSIPYLLELYAKPEGAGNRGPVLALIGELVSAARQMPKLSLTDDTAMQVDHPEDNVHNHGDDRLASIGRGEMLLSPYKSHLISILTSSLSSTSSANLEKVAALLVLRELVQTAELLEDEELAWIVNTCNDVLLSTFEDEAEDNIELRDQTLALFSTTANIPQGRKHILVLTLPPLFALLPDQPPPRSSAKEREKIWDIVDCLKRLCIQPELYETCVIRIGGRIDLLYSSPEGDEVEKAAYIHTLLHLLCQLLRVKTASRNETMKADIPKYVYTLVPQLFNVSIASALHKSSCGFQNERVLKVAGEIIGLVIKSLPVSRQTDFAESLISLYFDGNLQTPLSQGHHSISTEAFKVFAAASSTKAKNLVILLSPAIISLRPETPLPVTNLATFLDGMLVWSLECAESQTQRETTWQFVASLLNKRSSDSGESISSLLPKFWENQIRGEDKPLARRKFAMSSWGWVCKALLMRSHSSAHDLVSELLTLFPSSSAPTEEQQQLGYTAAQTLGLCVARSDNVLGKDVGGVVKVLYAQKFVNTFLVKLVEGARANVKDAGKSGTETETTYLVALTSVLVNVPSETYKPQMNVILPLLLRALDLPSMDIRASVIVTITSFASSSLSTLENGESKTEKNDNPLITEHVSTIINSMLKNALDLSDARVRQLSLSLLGLLPSVVPYSNLYPHKSRVVKELARVLDDKKKSVRKQAVEARTYWYKL